MGVGKAVGWSLFGWLAGSALQPQYGVPVVLLVAVLTGVASAVHLRSHHRQQFARAPGKRGHR